MAQESFALLPVKTGEEIATTAQLAEKIWNECFADILTQGQIDYMLDKFQSIHAMEGQMANQNYEYFLAFVEGRPVGYMGIAAENGRLMLSKIYLLQEMRGTGLAGYMFTRLEEMAKERGCGTIWLTVNRHNARAIAAYKKRGFAVTREQVADIGGGYVMDDYVLEKKLADLQ